MQYRRSAGTRGIRRFIRISMLLTVIVVRPRWLPLLAGTVLTVFGIVEWQSTMGSIFVIPGFIFLWCALLIAGDTEADRERRAQLKRELAAFSTPAQRCDLEAILDRYPDGVTYEMRDILASQAVTSHRNGIPGSGPY